MRERTFVSRHEAMWTELERLVDRADLRGLKSFTPAELRDLALRYRATTGDLAAAQSREYTDDLRLFLNRLTARAHAYVYAQTSRGGVAPILDLFARTFPREFRRSGGFIAAITLIFAISTVVAYVVTIQRPASIYGLLDSSSIPEIKKSIHDSNFNVEATLSPVMSAQIITNNIRVTAFAFAGGMTLGLGTLWAIVTNGLMFGGLGALFTLKGFGPDFWATVAPHGVIELTAIQISGAAGLLIAKSILVPGRLRRSDSIREGARRAGILMIGVMGMLVVAGTIEGFYTPRRTPIQARAGFGAATAVCLVAYFSLAGRGPRRRRARAAAAL